MNQKIQRLKDVYESLLHGLTCHPTPNNCVFPHVTQQLQQQNTAGQDFDDEPPTIKLRGAPFTSKLFNVVKFANVVRQGHRTLVTTIQLFEDKHKLNEIGKEIRNREKDENKLNETVDECQVNTKTIIISQIPTRSPYTVLDISIINTQTEILSITRLEVTCIGSPTLVPT
ncbi:8392_t:CDS:2 [Dentiscutata erythropus]|uniref:8392_t:CDS:1 n=1 Tax=Dentiscutata erythropus TaxID=1348616 RepID=A0A9N9FPU2_9GLOM|nr:8392_t:CDS:2 [Dentiscutata erythropus]